MAPISDAVLDLKRLDLLANGDTAIHRLDARAKVLVTLVFIISVVSFHKYELTPLFPFFVFPAVMIACGNLPPRYLAWKIALLCPFALLVGMFNPFFDREVLVQLGPVAISGGWVSFASVMVRTILTVGAAFILVALTGFSAVCQALEQLGMPRAFTVQLLFLYRYIFVLTEEGTRAARARELRSCGKKGLGVHSYSSLVGHLLLRTWQRAERIHMSMLARGFNGQFHARRLSRFGTAELLFLLGWSTFFIVLRLLNVSQMLGTFITRILP